MGPALFLQAATAYYRTHLPDLADTGPFAATDGRACFLVVAIVVSAGDAGLVYWLLLAAPTALVGVVLVKFGVDLKCEPVAYNIVPLGRSINRQRHLTKSVTVE